MTNQQASGPGGTAAGAAVARVAVTGANGFVGRYLLEYLQRSGRPARAVRRRDAVSRVPGPDWGDTGSLAASLDGAGTVIHAAGSAHHRSSGEVVDRSLWQGNVQCVGQVIEAAARAGVRRIVLVSSIAAGSAAGIAESGRELAGFPASARYGVSKLSGERLAVHLCDRHGMELAICRPPMVYGRNAPGNYQRLRWLVAHGVPIPRIGPAGRRSVLGIRNLCHALVTAVDDNRVLARPWEMADTSPVTYLEFAQFLSAAMGRRLYTLPMPVHFLKLLLGAMGRAPDLSRICEDVVSNDSGSRELGWSAPYTTSEELSRAESPVVL